MLNCEWRLKVGLPSIEIILILGGLWRLNLGLTSKEMTKNTRDQDVLGWGGINAWTICKEHDDDDNYDDVGGGYFVKESLKIRKLGIKSQRLYGVTGRKLSLTTCASPVRRDKAHTFTTWATRHLIPRHLPTTWLINALLVQVHIVSPWLRSRSPGTKCERFIAPLLTGRHASLLYCHIEQTVIARHCLVSDWRVTSARV